MSDLLDRLVPRVGRASPADAPEPAIVTKSHRLTFLGACEPTLRAMFDDIARARSRVAVACFIVRDDRLGGALGEALAAAAARGVETRLMYDALGSEKTDPRFFERLAARGVQTRAYRPGRVQLATRSYGPREHSRIIYMDDAAYAGGIAFGDEWLPVERGGQGWHDVCVRAEGPCVRHFAAAFERRWREAVGDGAPEDLCALEDCDDVAFVADASVGSSKVYDLHREAIRRARSRVWIESAYFYPPPGLLQDLVDAARRGVDVRVLLPGVTDLPLMQHAGRAEYGAWIEYGLKIYEYQDRVMHAKFAVVDDDWSTVGSFNPNPPGIYWSNELNLFVYDKAFVARVARQFEADLANSEAFTAERAASRGVLEQARDRLWSDAMTVVDMLRSGSK